jgi:hypothetical protein
MDLKLTKNVVKGICSIKGPQVPYVLGDAGQANVMIHVALSDGTHMHFPDGSGAQATGSTVLPPGDYACTVMVAAFTHGAFGSTYLSSISIGGKKVASAEGEVPDGVEEEDDNQSFVLRVA